LKVHAAARYSEELAMGFGIITKGDTIGVVVIAVLAIILSFLPHLPVTLPAVLSLLSS